MMNPMESQVGRDAPGTTGRPVFDHQALQRLQALDPSGQNHLLMRVMKAFEVSLQRLSSQLRTAREQRDLASMRHVVHTLKSSSASVGALRLAQLCADVETRLRGLVAMPPMAATGGAAGYDDGAAGAVSTFDIRTVDAVLEEMRRVHTALPDLLASVAGAAARLPGSAAQAG
jgi:HPt (histidine-containing phosphotransfer) domain-containing protein